MAFVVKKKSKILPIIIGINLFVIIAAFVCNSIIESKLNGIEAVKQVEIIEKPKEWYDQYNFVAHAMGGIDETNYTNSLDAFMANYEKGFRVFEIDLSLTADSKLVGTHKWSNNFALSEKTFMSRKINNKYQPLNLKNVLEYLNEYKDIYIITDLKEIDSKEIIQFQIDEIVKTAKEFNEKILDRLIIQIYNQEMLSWVKEKYNFKNYIYTLYKTEDTEDEVVKFVQDNNIKVVTCKEEKAEGTFVGRLSSLGTVVYVHTINDTEIYNSLIQRGIHGIYTDFLVPAK